MSGATSDKKGHSKKNGRTIDNGQKGHSEKNDPSYPDVALPKPGKATSKTLQLRIIGN